MSGILNFEFLSRERLRDFVGYEPGTLAAALERSDLPLDASSVEQLADDQEVSGFLLIWMLNNLDYLNEEIVIPSTNGRGIERRRPKTYIDIGNLVGLATQRPINDHEIDFHILDPVHITKAYYGPEVAHYMMKLQCEGASGPRKPAVFLVPDANLSDIYQKRLDVTPMEVSGRQLHLVGFNGLDTKIVDRVANYFNQTR